MIKSIPESRGDQFFAIKFLKWMLATCRTPMSQLLSTMICNSLTRCWGAYWNYRAYIWYNLENSFNWSTITFNWHQEDKVHELYWVKWTPIPTDNKIDKFSKLSKHFMQEWFIIHGQEDHQYEYHRVKISK